MKTPATENEYNKAENCQSQIKSSDFTKNQIKIGKIKLNRIREDAKITNTDKKDRASLKREEISKIIADKFGKLYKRL